MTAKVLKVNYDERGSEPILTMKVQGHPTDALQLAYSVATMLLSTQWRVRSAEYHEPAPDAVDSDGIMDVTCARKVVYD